MLRAVDVPTLRAALWTLRALRQTRRSLGRRGVAAVRMSPPPAVPRVATRGVLAVLNAGSSTCLERALVLQRWEFAHGARKAVVIGVRGPAAHFEAHAWLDGEPDAVAGAYQELLRLPAGHE